jgi:hypothetical protein
MEPDMHTYTIYKVEAPDAETAVLAVNDFLDSSTGEDYTTAFDWYDPDYTEVLPDFTEADFQKLREDELATYRTLLDEALSLPDTLDCEKGHRLRRAGQLLEPDCLSSPDRLVLDLMQWCDTSDWCDESEPTGIYYVRTNRHS